MNPLHHFLVQVDDEYQRRIGTGIDGIPIEVSVLDKPYWHIQVSGKVVKSPSKIPAQHLYSEPAGFPHPLRYYGGADAAQAIAELQSVHKSLPSVANIEYEKQRYYEQDDNKTLDSRLESRYTYDRIYRVQEQGVLNKVNAALFERPVRHTIRGFGTENIREGDTILLRYSAFAPYQDQDGATKFANFSHFQDGKPVYKVNPSDVIGYERNGKVTMVNAHVAVKPVPQKGIEEVIEDGKPMLVRRSVSGKLLIPVVEKATKLLGQVVYEPTIKGYGHVKQGSMVYYSPDSEEKYTIKGQELYVMKAWELMACVEDDAYRPVADYVLLAPVSVKVDIGANIMLPDTASFTIFLTQGTVMKCGPNVQEVKNGQVVSFRGKANGQMGPSALYVEDQGYNWSVQVVPSMQLVTRKGCVLVRECDLLAVVQ